MKLHWVSILLVATGALAGSPADFAGKWKLASTWPDGPGLKTVVAVILDLEVDGDAVKGMAYIGSWPGNAPIAEGRVRGERISFDATGHLDSSTGIPTCHFEGNLVGNEMVLKMTMTRNPPNPSARETFVFKGKKQSE